MRLANVSSGCNTMREPDAVSLPMSCGTNHQPQQPQDMSFDTKLTSYYIPEWVVMLQVVSEPFYSTYSFPSNMTCRLIILPSV